MRASRRRDPLAAELDPVEVEEVVRRPAGQRAEDEVQLVQPAWIGQGEGLTRIRRRACGRGDVERAVQRAVDGVEMELDGAGDARGCCPARDPERERVDGDQVERSVEQQPVAVPEAAALQAAPDVGGRGGVRTGLLEHELHLLLLLADLYLRGRRRSR